MRNPSKSEEKIDGGNACVRQKKDERRKQINDIFF
jgi:hypothetical protein